MGLKTRLFSCINQAFQIQWTHCTEIRGDGEADHRNESEWVKIKRTLTIAKGGPNEKPDGRELARFNTRTKR